MVTHEINVSELVAGNKFSSVNDGLKLFNELERLLNINDEFIVDFLGIEVLGTGALFNSIGRLYEEGKWDINVLNRIKYVNVTNEERNKIRRFIERRI